MAGIKPLKQTYLLDEEAEEILSMLQKRYPGDGIYPSQENLFYSAVARPKTRAFYEGEVPIAEHAARQMLAFAEVHALSNGNKRMGLWASYIVLRNNGYTFKQNSFFSRLSPLLEQFIKYKKHSLGFLALTISLFIEEASAPSIEDFHKLESKHPRKRSHGKKKWKSRKR